MEKTEEISWWFIINVIVCMGTFLYILSIIPTEASKIRYEVRKTIKDNNLSLHKDLRSDYYIISKMNDDEKIILSKTYNYMTKTMYFKGANYGMIREVGILNFPTKNNLKKVCWLENIINDISDSGAIPPNGATFLNCNTATYEDLDDYVGSKFKKNWVIILLSAKNSYEFFFNFIKYF